jgi:hypothetical protein
VRSGLVGLSTHVLAIVVAFLAVRLSRSTEDLGDLAAGATGLFLVEILAGFGCLIGGSVLFVRGRRDVGIGLLAGWVVGLVILFLLSRLL